MDHRDFRILGLAGSLRRASFHRGIVRAAHEVAPEWMSCESFDLARIPYFNQDIEDQGNPDPVKELREKIRTYDAVLIATPEYDYAIPGIPTSCPLHSYTPIPHINGKARTPRPFALPRSYRPGPLRQAADLSPGRSWVLDRD